MNSTIITAGRETASQYLYNTIEAAIHPSPLDLQ